MILRVTCAVPHARQNVQSSRRTVAMMDACRAARRPPIRRSDGHMGRLAVVRLSFRDPYTDRSIRQKTSSQLAQGNPRPSSAGRDASVRTPITWLHCLVCACCRTTRMHSCFDDRVQGPFGSSNSSFPGSSYWLHRQNKSVHCCGVYFAGKNWWKYQKKTGHPGLEISLQTKKRQVPEGQCRDLIDCELGCGSDSRTPQNAHVGAAIGRNVTWMAVLALSNSPPT